MNSVTLWFLIWAGSSAYSCSSADWFSTLATSPVRLGMNAMLGINPKIGGAISALIAILIFSSKKAGMALDRLVILLGAIMILLMLYVAVTAHPPVGEALKQSVMPDHVDFLVITTLIGGTVGGYITFAGAHRMIDSGHTYQSTSKISPVPP